MRESCEGTPEISAPLSWLGQPLVAATLGMLLGVALMLVSHRAVLFVTPKGPFRGLAIVGVMMGARFTLALAALAAFSIFAPDGLAPFGIALAISFVTGLFVEAVRLSGSHATSTSA